MTTFDKQEKAHEAKYAHDQETDFKVMARRNKLLGLWVAEQFGLSGDEAAAYAKEVVISDFDRPGDEDVFEKVDGDFKAKNVEMSEHRIRRHMEELLIEARDQIAKE
jgi:hypothetical protein